MTLDSGDTGGSANVRNIQATHTLNRGGAGDPGVQSTHSHRDRPYLIYIPGTTADIIC
jgi:hypothetical protein